MKVTKILSLVLTLALLIIGAVAVTASAEEAPTVEITSKNLSYESNISILFAVKTANTDVAPELNVYTNVDGELTLKETVDAAFTPENSETAVGYADAYIFFTSGIVAKALDTEIYVQAVVGETKSAMERYSVVEYCHEMNAKKSTDLYTNIITYGATVQKMLEEDGKFSGAYATDYKYVTIDGGTLDGTYDSGIYLEGEKVYPQADGVTAWASSDGKTVMNGDEYIVGENNVNFEEGEAPLTITYRPGTYGFDDLVAGDNVKPSSSSYSFGVETGYTTYGVISEDVRGSASNVFKATPTANFNKLTLYQNNGATLSPADANGFEVSFDFKFEAGKNTVYSALVDASAGAIFYINFKTEDSGNGIYVWNNKTGTEKATIFQGLVGEYNHMAFKCVEKDGAIVCELWANGSCVMDFVTQNVACTDLTTFSKARIASNSGGLNPIYLDNIYVGYVKD